MEVVGSSPIDPTSTVGLVSQQRRIGKLRSFFIPVRGRWGENRAGVNRPQCGLRAALTDERRARRKSPIDPTKLQWEFVAPLGTASKEAVFLLPTEIFVLRKRALSACFLKAIRIRRYPLASRQPFPSSALAAFSPRLLRRSVPLPCPSSCAQTGMQIAPLRRAKNGKRRMLLRRFPFGREIMRKGKKKGRYSPSPVEGEKNEGVV